MKHYNYDNTKNINSVLLHHLIIYSKILIICFISNITYNLLFKSYILDLSNDLDSLLIFPLFYVLIDIVFKSFHWPKD